MHFFLDTSDCRSTKVSQTNSHYLKIMRLKRTMGTETTFHSVHDTEHLESKGNLLFTASSTKAASGAHRRCSLSIYRMWRRVRKPRTLLLSGGPWARHVILPSVDASPVSGAVALAGHAVPKSCEGITPDVCCAPTVCRCSVPECSPRGKRERGRAVKIALSVTSTAGRARMLWGHGHQVGPLPSSTVALVTPTLLSLLTLRKYSEKEIRRLGGLPSEMQPQLCTLS